MKKIIQYIIIAAMLVAGFTAYHYIMYEANETGYPVHQFTREYYHMYNRGFKKDCTITIPEECHKDTSFFSEADVNHDHEVTFAEMENRFKKADLDDDGIISDAEAQKLRYDYSLYAIQE